MVTAQAVVTLASCRTVARRDGLVAGWTALLTATGAPETVHGPRGHGLCPPGWQARSGGADDRPAGWVLGLTWMRLGVSQWLLDQAREYLTGRTTGGVPLIQQQLVQGSLAEIVTEQQGVAAVLDALEHDPDPSLAAYLHRQLTDADRASLRLLGAGGFLTDGPGGIAHLSELLADAYLDGVDHGDHRAG
ncbi:acyl-CoA dehydrogenase family protein [Verrucosispora sp. NA02020]|uniref:acyl-CoA dehydrogenase family protein n=1 Tax=Verrucosispora sp. NA02020 TaxID=2742132 RepID=UPI003D7302F6